MVCGGLPAKPLPVWVYQKHVYKHNILGYFYVTTTKYSGDRRFDPFLTYNEIVSTTAYFDPYMSAGSGI